MPTGKGRSVTERSQVPAVARPLPEPEPQPVLAPLTTAAIFMVLTIEPGGEQGSDGFFPARLDGQHHEDRGAGERGQHRLRLRLGQRAGNRGNL